MSDGSTTIWARKADSARLEQYREKNETKAEALRRALDEAGVPPVTDLDRSTEEILG